jgi:hypothetical protein
MNEKQPELMQTMLGLQCPECHKDVVLGIGMYAPVTMFALTPAQLEAKKVAVLAAIAASTLGQPQKDVMIEQYGNPKVMIDPAMADLMLQELTTTYSPQTPTIEVATKIREEANKEVPVTISKIKKPRGIKEPKA